MSPTLDWRGRLRRWTRWEYWPTWALYTPVALRLLPHLLSKPMAFTAANPALPGAGIVGESKIDIQNQLEQAASEFCCPTLYLPIQHSADHLTSSLIWMKENDLDFPLVLKPNAAQRGLGVLFAHCESELKNHLSSIQSDYLIQPKLLGREYSLFFIRPPEKKGFIFSMTRKSPPVVIGDGISSTLELARAHPRHRPVIHLLPELKGDLGNHIPPKGKSVQLSSIGAHCRGSTFTDGRDLITPALTQKIQSVFDGMEGWHFGRFDLFSEKEDLLRQGLGFVFIELNGVTSEATHIYDPKYGIFHAWKTLSEQWRWAIRIGLNNHRQGHSLLSLKEVLALNRDFNQEAQHIPG